MYARPIQGLDADGHYPPCARISKQLMDDWLDGSSESDDEDDSDDSETSSDSDSDSDSDGSRPRPPTSMFLPLLYVPGRFCHSRRVNLVLATRGVHLCARALIHTALCHFTKL